MVTAAAEVDGDGGEATVVGEAAKGRMVGEETEEDTGRMVEEEEMKGKGPIVVEEGKAVVVVRTGGTKALVRLQRDNVRK